MRKRKQRRNIYGCLHSQDEKQQCKKRTLGKSGVKEGKDEKEKEEGRKEGSWSSH